MARVSLGIIGLGQIGLKYDLDKDNLWKKNQIMTHVGSANKSKLFGIKYLIDENENTLELAKQLFPKTKCLTLGDALQFQGPDMLVIAAPTSTHLSIVNEIEGSWNPKIFLLEKPMGANSNEADEIFKKLSVGAAFVIVNYFRRFLPHTRNLVENEIFIARGRLRKVSIHGYGTLNNIFSHFIDLIVFFEGSEILDLGRKDILEATGSTLFLKDLNTGIYYTFYGLGDLPRACEMRLEYDNLIIVMSENGRSFNLFGEGETLVHSEYLSQENFNRYQKYVYSFISKQLNHLPGHSNMLDSLKIHRFFESIELSRG